MLNCTVPVGVSVDLIGVTIAVSKSLTAFAGVALAAVTNVEVARDDAQAALSSVDSPNPKERGNFFGKRFLVVIL